MASKSVLILDNWFAVLLKCVSRVSCMCKTWLTEWEWAMFPTLSKCGLLRGAGFGLIKKPSFCYWPDQTIATAHESLKIPIGGTCIAKCILECQMHHFQLCKLHRLMDVILSQRGIQDQMTSCCSPTGCIAYSGGAAVRELHSLPFHVRQLVPRGYPFHHERKQWGHHCHLQIHVQEAEHRGTHIFLQLRKILFVRFNQSLEVPFPLQQRGFHGLANCLSWRMTRVSFRKICILLFLGGVSLYMVGLVYLLGSSSLYFLTYLPYG